MPSATEDIWQAFAEPLRRFIVRRVGDETRAEDLLADVFVRIHRGLGSLEDPQRIAPWLYRIARNAIIDHHRRGDDTEPLPAEGPTGDEAAGDDDDETRELARCVRPMVERLPEPYREAVQLAELDGLSQVELASQLGLSHSGAKSRVQRGREMLKAMILQCCDVELDRRGNVLGYQPRSSCCNSDDTPC